MLSSRDIDGNNYGRFKFSSDELIWLNNKHGINNFIDELGSFPLLTYFVLLLFIN